MGDNIQHIVSQDDAEEFLLSYSTIRESKSKLLKALRIFYQCVEDDDYESLFEEFNKFSLADMVLFFDKYRGAVLNCSIVTSTSNKPLDFLINNVHPRLMKDMLSEDNYKLVDVFISLQGQMEHYAKTYQESMKTRELRIRRLYLLLKVDYEGVKNFINERAPYVTTTMQEDFQIAKKQFESEQSSTKHRPIVY